MKAMYSWFITLPSAFLLMKHYYIMLNAWAYSLTNYFLFKVNKLYMGMSFGNFWFFISMIYLTSFFASASFTDLMVSDTPSSLYGSFELIYSFWDVNYNLSFYMKFPVNVVVPVLSMSELFPSSSWMEREAWDMYGLKFLLHNDLSRMLTDYGFYGHPLRKDFPLLGFFELSYSDLMQSICSEPITSAQAMRVFTFSSPWMATTNT